MKTIHAILALSIGGTLFSGFLTVTKLFSGSCPLAEGCPYFLGYPSCLWGLLLFGTLFLAALLHMKAMTRDGENKYRSIIQIVSGIGILFAGYSSAIEILYPNCLTQPCTYTLILPSCVYGLAMYALIFIFAWKLQKE